MTSFAAATTQDTAMSASFSKDGDAAGRSSCTTGGVFSRESIHSFLDKLMDMFQMDRGNSSNSNTTGSLNGGEDPANVTLEENGTDGTQEDREDTEVIEEHNDERCLLKGSRKVSYSRKRRSTAFDGRESYDDTDDDSTSVGEDSLQDYRFMVGGMNMTKFGGFAGTGYNRSTSALLASPALTAVSERTDEEESVATAYRLGRTSCSSSVQQQQQPYDVLSTLSSLSQAFLRSTRTNSFTLNAAAANANANTPPAQAPVAAYLQQQGSSTTNKAMVDAATTTAAEDVSNTNKATTIILGKTSSKAAASRRSTASTGDETEGEDDDTGNNDETEKKKSENAPDQQEQNEETV